MKKIFMASICAIMAVTAANADIASTTYVDTAVKDLETTDNKATAITSGMQKDVMYPTVKLTEELIGISNQDMSDLIGDVADNTTVMAEVAKKVSIAQGDTAKQKLMNTDDKGNVVAAGIVDDAGNATGANYVTGLAVNAKGELVVSKGKIDVGGDINAAIVGLDATVDAADGKVVTGVVETDGKLTSVKSTSITSAYIENETILSEDIKNGEVKTDDIANAAVTAAKLADNAVTAGKILATELDAGAGEGKYALTANVNDQGNIVSYSWEFIGR